MLFPDWNTIYTIPTKLLREKSSCKTCSAPPIPLAGSRSLTQKAKSQHLFLDPSSKGFIRGLSLGIFKRQRGLISFRNSAPYLCQDLEGKNSFFPGFGRAVVATRTSPNLCRNVHLSNHTLLTAEGGWGWNFPPHPQNPRTEPQIPLGMFLESF